MRANRFLAIAPAAFLLLAGCTPPGPRALLDGKRLIEKGRYDQAVSKLQIATSILTTNAQAWNYLGLACQHAGRASEAETAYRRALTFNHDLMEARYNLGCLLIAMNRFEDAKSELTAYTLRRSNSLEGLMQLAVAQTGARDLAGAEKTYNAALRLGPPRPEAWNGLGLVHTQRGRYAEAIQDFNRALKLQPAYGPALLNLAIISHQNLKNIPLALQNYRAYVALKPRPPNAAAVESVLRQLEREAGPTGQVVPPHPSTQVVSNPTLSHPTPTNLNRPPKPSPRAEVTTNAPRVTPAAALAKSSPAPQPPTNSQSGRMPAEPLTRLTSPPVFVAAVTPPATPTSTPTSTATSTPALSPARTQVVATPSPPPSRPMQTNPPPRSGGMRTNPPVSIQSNENLAKAVKSASAPPSTSRTPDVPLARPSVQSVPPGRYPYLVPAKPQPGDHAAAERFFAEGLSAQQAHRLADAEAAYRRALQLDPAYFDAQYDLALALSESGKLPTALRAFESALFIRPESIEARLAFAQGLKQAGFVTDAQIEFEKVLTQYPTDPRAHLALGNIYAKQLRQPSKARQHYLKLLEADPANSQADAVRYWLSANPP